MQFTLGTKYYFYDNFTGENKTKSNVIITLENNQLIFNYEIFDDELVSPYNKDNEDLYNHDVVEVFISFDGKKEKYYEYELTPFNIRFFGLIKNPTLDKPYLTRITPEFKSEVNLFNGGYFAKIVIDLKEKTSLEDVLLNCYWVDYSNNECKFYSINPTLNPSFHISSFLSPIK
jgi:hypothetical protein